MTDIVCQDKPRIPAYPQGSGQRGIFSFTKENIPLLIPQEKGFPIASEQLEELQCLPIATSCARRCRVSTATRSASASIIRCCATVGSFAALRMRHTPCGCRSACLVVVQPNFRLPRHPSMRRAKQCRIRQAVCRQANVTRASR